MPRFAFPESGPLLARTTTTGAFFDVVGRRAAVFGYENRPFEAWVYPLKIFEDARLTFNLENYPVPSDGLQIMRRIEVRPEATTLVYTHPAFTVRQTILAPIDEPGIVMLLDVDALRPLTVTMELRPDLSLMWPAGLMTGFVGFDAARGRYFTGEETQRFVGVFGSPLARDVSVQPYQEEPQDVPTRFEMTVTPDVARDFLIPIVVAGSTTGRADAEAAYDRILQNVPALFAETAAHYRRLDRTMQISTPDDRLDEAFAWAKVGMDKGLATSPDLGTGLVAGYRTSGNSERPGFAWFFGRDALWTALATTAVGDFETTRTALRFLAQFQREDGKIPHEISQSAAYLDWFEDYPYPWASADATPLFVIALADYWRLSATTPLCASTGRPRAAPGPFPPPPTATATGSSRTRAWGTAGSKAARSTRRTKSSTSKRCSSRPAATSRSWPSMMGEGDLARAARARAEPRSPPPKRPTGTRPTASTPFPPPTPARPR